MADFVELGDVNQFLPKDKLTLAEADRDATLETTAEQRVVSALRPIYDVSTWTLPGSTPILVKSIAGMFVAGWIYNRQFSQEASDATSYGNQLLAQAEGLLQGLVSGDLSLDDLDILPTGEPAYGLAAEPIFTMGEVF